MIRYRETTYKFNYRTGQDEKVDVWHKTHGEFVRWERAGMFNILYAVIFRKASVLFIPSYDLHKDDRAALVEKYPIS